MKNTKFFVLFLFLVFSFSVFGLNFVQTAKALTTQEIQNIVKGAKHTLADFGLSEESAKYLSAKELQQVLNSKSPAEVAKELKSSPQPANSGVLANVVNCFDYYKFGSVQTALTAQSFNFKPGDTINFKGPINNQNDYPIVAGTLYVKIFRQRSITKDANGPDVVDQFIAKDNIIIPAKGSNPVSFSWKVPSSLSAGDYKIASFFIVDKKFNLLGLSFTNDVIGNSFNFHVSGIKSNVQFDEAGVIINNTPYFFAAYPPRVSSKDPAVVSAKINNSTASDQTVNILWKLYRWDSIDPANLIRTVSATSVIKAYSSNNIQITIPEASEPVYYLVGELTYKDSKSIVDIRFVRPEVDRTRLNFPSITSFPLKNNVASTMFSCLHNSGASASVPNGKLTLKLKDANGKTVDEYTYQGAVTGAMMAIKKDFKSKSNLDHFFLSAQLWQADKLVDQSTLEYDCNKIDPKLCNPKNYLGVFILFAIIAIIAIYGTVMFIKRKK